MVTPAAINSGHAWQRPVCLALTGERLHELDLPAMVSDNTALRTKLPSPSTPKGAASPPDPAHDRAQRSAPRTRPPSSRARATCSGPREAGGVLERRGHTEAAVDLASLAGFHPAGVICEIVNDDGTMARVPDLVQFCNRHGLVMTTVAALARHRAELDEGGFLAAMDGVFADCLRDPQPLQN